MRTAWEEETKARAPTRGVLRKGLTDPHQAQGDLNIQETCDRDRKVDKYTSYRAEEWRVAHVADAGTSLLVGELVLPLGLTPTPVWGFSN